MLIEFLAHRKQGYFDDLLDLHHQVLIQHFLLAKELFEVLEGELVARLVLSVVLVEFLDGVVRQVHVEVSHLVLTQGVVVGRCSQVPIAEEENFVLVRHQDPHTDVEFPVTHQ